MKEISEIDILSFDIKKAYQDNVQEYNKAVREYQELRAITLNYEIGHHIQGVLDQKKSYEESLQKIEDLKKQVVSYQENMARLVEYIKKAQKFCNDFNAMLEKIYHLNEEKKYREIIDVLDKVDKDMLKNPYHIDYVDQVRQVYFWTRCTAWHAYLLTHKEDLPAIQDYIATSKMLRTYHSYLAEKISRKDIKLWCGDNPSFYVEDSYRYLMQRNQAVMKAQDNKSDKGFDTFYAQYLDTKENTRSYSNIGRNAFMDYEKDFMEWFNNLSHVAFYEHKDLGESLGYFRRIKSLNPELVSDPFYKESKDEKEFTHYFEENILATCTRDEMKQITVRAIAGEELEGLNVILGSAKLQVAFVPDVVTELVKALDINKRWALCDELITDFRETVHQELLDALISNCLQKQFITWSLPEICHHLYLAYNNTENKKNLNRIVIFAKRIFSSPRVYRNRHKLEGHEIIQIYNLAFDKPFNKKESFFYFGSQSQIVTGEEKFLPKSRGFINFSKTMLYILMVLCIAVAVAAFVWDRVLDATGWTLFAGKLGPTAPISYYIAGYGVAGLFAVFTFKTVFYNSDDEISALISRYLIYAILIIGTGVYSYFFFVYGFKNPNLNYFNANQINISIAIAIVGAILNLTSLFYINLRESRGARITLMVLSGLITLYLVGLCGYTIYGWDASLWKTQSAVSNPLFPLLFHLM